MLIFWDSVTGVQSAETQTKAPKEVNCGFKIADYICCGTKMCVGGVKRQVFLASKMNHCETNDI